MKTKQELKKILKKIIQSIELKCSLCNSKTKKAKKKYEQICTWKGCKKRSSILRRTIFHRIKISKIKLLRILDLWIKKINTKAISFIARVSTKTVRRVLKYLKKIQSTNIMKTLSL